MAEEASSGASKAGKGVSGFNIGATLRDYSNASNHPVASWKLGSGTQRSHQSGIINEFELNGWRGGSVRTRMACITEAKRP
jgi:hypothetical protein